VCGVVHTQVEVRVWADRLECVEVGFVDVVVAGTEVGTAAR
jgi:hypothetical protein